MTSTRVEGRPLERVLGLSPGQVAADEVDQLVIVEEAIELLDLWLEVEPDLRD